MAAAAPPAQMAAKPRSQSTADTLRTIDEQKNEKVQAYAVITTPDRNVQWRARGAVVEKSTDAARTWTATPIEPTAEWTAGSAPSTTVCWLVGRGGAVARTVDGRTWQRLTFPAPTDLSAVQASDAQTATITTADGRTFVTTDGGNTWIPRVLQEFPAAPFKE